MPQPNAFMNHGRWLYRCPRCKTAIEAEHDICPRCWPGIMAMAFQPIEGTKLLRRVSYPESVAQARAQAATRKEIYKPVYPPNKNEIEKILRVRDIRHMNWEPGETVELLLKENRAHDIHVKES